LRDPTRRIGDWFQRHPIVKYSVFGAVGFGLARWDDRPGDVTLFRLLGSGALAIAAFTGQEHYLARTFYRDFREAHKKEFDAAFVLDKTDEMGWATGRDLRETLLGGEVALAMLGALALGVLATGFAVGFFLVAVFGATHLSAENASWSKPIMWGAGLIAGLFSLSVMIDEPLSALRYWFASRRLIQRQQLDALRILAATPGRDGESAPRG
jgi:hypothetical protein